jgi:hypothetical protein
VINTGLDNGYSGNDSIGMEDPHYGWELGRFVVGGFSSTVKADGMDVFLKNVGDTVRLSFKLDQDIENLNGVDGLAISEDRNGYDQRFQTEKTNFGHGALLVKYTDYRNLDGQPTIYTDYLTGKLQGADTEIQLLEEGDYEVALDYEVASPGLVPFTKTYNNYRLGFRFAVRNGNAMVFPFDVVTGSELPGDSITEAGFRLDLAMSRYLNVGVTKEVLSDRSRAHRSTELAVPARRNCRGAQGCARVARLRGETARRGTPRMSPAKLGRTAVHRGVSKSRTFRRLGQGCRRVGREVGTWPVWVST